MTVFDITRLRNAANVPEATAIADNDDIIVSQNGQTRRFGVADFFARLPGVSAPRRYEKIITEQDGFTQFNIGFTPVSTDALIVTVEEHGEVNELTVPSGDYTLSGQTITVAKRIFPPATFRVYGYPTAAIASEARIAALEGNRVRFFASRAALVSYMATDPTHVNGDIFQVGRLQWEYEFGADVVGDLPNLRPAGLFLGTSHFETETEAYDYAAANNIPVFETNGNEFLSYGVGNVVGTLPFNLGRCRIGQLTDWNQTLNDAYLSIGVQLTNMKSRISTATPGHQRMTAFSAHITMDDFDGEGDVTAGVFSASLRKPYNANRALDTNGTYPGRVAVLGINSSVFVQEGADGASWGAYIATVLPRENSGGTIDAFMTGLEIGVRNFGGASPTDPRSGANRKYNLLLVDGSGAAATATDPQPLTCMLSTANSVETMGWHQGLFVRCVRENFLWLSQPHATGARGLLIDATAGFGSWDQDVIVIPQGTGMGSITGSTVTSAFTLEATSMDINRHLAVARDGVNSRLYLRSLNTGLGNRMFIQMEGSNDADETIEYAYIAGGILDATDGSEDGSVIVTTISGGAAAIAATFRDGSIRSGTGGFYFSGSKVVGDRVNGWGAPTGTATRSTFATSTVTTEQLAERVKALIDDLTTHGLIGA